MNTVSYRKAREFSNVSEGQLEVPLVNVFSEVRALDILCTLTASSLRLQ